jgi:hypothetical protein
LILIAQIQIKMAKIVVLGSLNHDVFLKLGKF